MGIQGCAGLQSWHTPISGEQGPLIIPGEMSPMAMDRLLPELELLRTREPQTCSPCGLFLPIGRANCRGPRKG